MVVLLIPAGQDPMSCTATLYRQLHVTLDTMCAVGCSDLYCNPGEIYEKYTFARQIEELTYWGSAGGIRSYDGRLVPKADCSALVSSASKMIQNYIWLRDLYSTLHQIDVLAAALQEREDLTKDYFIHYMLSILALFPAKGMEKKFFIRSAADRCLRHLAQCQGRAGSICRAVFQGKWLPFPEVFVHCVQGNNVRAG